MNTKREAIRVTGWNPQPEYCELLRLIDHLKDLLDNDPRTTTRTCTLCHWVDTENNIREVVQISQDKSERKWQLCSQCIDDIHDQRDACIESEDLDES